MNTKELVKALTYLESVTGYEWDLVRGIVDRIADGEAVVLSSEWLNWKKGHVEFYPLNLSVVKTWSTQEEGVKLEFFIRGGNVLCEAVISDINNSRYFSKENRFKATIQLKQSFVRSIGGLIEWNLYAKASRAYEDHLEKQRQEWIKSFKDNIITYFQIE
jgi:hypothetical protein